jgi:predicted RNA-binding protein with PUA domain
MKNLMRLINQNLETICYIFLVRITDGLRVPKSTLVLLNKIYHNKTPSKIYIHTHIKSCMNFDLSCSLNSLYKNLMGYKNLGCFEFSESLFLSIGILSV